MNHKGRLTLAAIGLTLHLTLGTLIRAEPAEPEITWKLEERRIVQVHDSDQIVDLEMSCHAIEFVSRRDGRAIEARLFSLFDTQTGLLWWAYLRGPDSGLAERIDYFLGLSAFYYSQDRIVRFWYSGASLWVSESRRKYESREEAYRDLKAQLRREGQELELGLGHGFYEVKVFRELGAAFFVGPHVSRLVSETKITLVLREGAGWTVGIQGYGGREAIISMDENYELLGVEVRQQGD